MRQEEVKALGVAEKEETYSVHGLGDGKCDRDWDAVASALRPLVWITGGGGMGGVSYCSPLLDSNLPSTLSVPMRVTT